MYFITILSATEYCPQLYDAGLCLQVGVQNCNLGRAMQQSRFCTISLTFCFCKVWIYLWFGGTMKRSVFLSLQNNSQTFVCKLWIMWSWLCKLVAVNATQNLQDSASSFHWLSSSIFSYCSFGRLSRIRPTYSHLHFMIRPYKPQIFCEDMILATS